GFYALEVARQTNGVIESVTDAEVIAGIKLLAEHEGIFTETAGGVTIGVLKKLTEAGTISSDELTVAYITGSGLKTQETMAGQLEPRIEIPPNLDAFEETKAKWR
ncbi:MAG: pyridoxal-phosphate dependent enzyme, partial [Armatimonadetes bacterium]|nr:pyridoxal-phosphate dependent enzyme [Armatimonadota bacterium]